MRLSLFDFPPFYPDPAQTSGGKFGPGIPHEYPLPYPGFGCDRDDPLAIDLAEPIATAAEALRDELRSATLVNLTAGSPYYNPHVQRPAYYPPSDGYQPPEDPLVGCCRQIEAVAAGQAAGAGAADRGHGLHVFSGVSAARGPGAWSASSGPTWWAWAGWCSATGTCRPTCSAAARCKPSGSAAPSATAPPAPQRAAQRLLPLGPPLQGLTRGRKSQGRQSATARGLAGAQRGGRGLNWEDAMRHTNQTLIWYIIAAAGVVSGLVSLGVRLWVAVLIVFAPIVCLLGIFFLYGVAWNVVDKLRRTRK